MMLKRKSTFVLRRALVFLCEHEGEDEASDAAFFEGFNRAFLVDFIPLAWFLEVVEFRVALLSEAVDVGDDGYSSILNMCQNSFRPENNEVSSDRDVLERELEHSVLNVFRDVFEKPFGATDIQLEDMCARIPCCCSHEIMCCQPLLSLNT